MADTTTTNLTLTKPEVGGSTDSWGTKYNANADAVDAVFAADGTGTSVGLNVGTGKTLAVTGTVSGDVIATLTGTQTLTNKTLTSPVVTTPTLRDSTDTTKRVQFGMTGISTGATRVLTVPDANTTLVGTNTTQTLTNKTLTSPQINGGNAEDLGNLSIAAGRIMSLNYTPTITGVSNLDSSTASACQYMRVGDVVTVSGQLNFVPAVSGGMTARVSLPVASDLLAVGYLAGVGMGFSGSTAIPARIRGDTTNDAATFTIASTAGAGIDIAFTFTYRVV